MRDWMTLGSAGFVALPLDDCDRMEVDPQIDSNPFISCVEGSSIAINPW
jgi:hypothetical protein